MTPSRRVVLLRRIMPWISLALGVTSAFTMNRRPERAPLVAVAAASGWILLAALALLSAAASKKLVARAARLGAALGSQSLLQLCLFFAAPFFARAAAMPAHWAFVALVAIAGALTLWTPLGEVLLRHPIAGAALQSVGTFAGLDCVLPLIGLSNRVSLFAATLATCVGLLLVAWAQRTRLVIPLVAAATLLALFDVGAMRYIPPAPLQFVDGKMGTRVVDRQVIDPATDLVSVPDQLVCFTAIAAPRGLRDRLHHVWRQNGALRADVPLEIRGGRAQGYRTWSTKHGVAPGTWTCTVETESGQLLGRASVRVY